MIVDTTSPESLEDAGKTFPRPPLRRHLRHLSDTVDDLWRRPVGAEDVIQAEDLDFRRQDLGSEDGVVVLSFLYVAFVRFLQLVPLSFHGEDELAVEVVMLRHEVSVLRRQVARPGLAPPGRAVLAAFSRLLSTRRRGRFFVKPETLLRWHRDLVRRRWTKSHARPGRPGVPAGTVAMVLQLSRENPTWGYRRIHGELATMGVRLAPSSVWAILRRHGIDPTPRRSGPTWLEFTRAQAATMMACDFSTVDTVLLRRPCVLFFVELDTRRVHLSGITANPTGRSVTQQARNLSFELAERSRPVKFLIRDRDAKFTASFDEVFRADGIAIPKTPLRAPRANSVAERFVAQYVASA